MRVQFYPKALILTAFLLMLGMLVDAWAVAAASQVAAVVAIAVIMAKRVWATRHRPSVALIP